MKTKNIFALAASLLISATLASGAIDPKPSVEKGDGFVVLELFTSEGCSSCPRADELLGNVQKQVGDKQIYILAYHIDYWDHQGWRDIFSNADYSRRQYWYAGMLNTQVYTPQVVVNGKTEFVGSDQAALANVLRNNLQGTPTNTLKLIGKLDAREMAVTYETSGSKNVELVIAVVQKNAVRQIKRGENNGRTLRHVQIVRKLDSFKLSKTGAGQVNIPLPNGFTEAEWEVIGFLQDKKTGTIHAANRVNLKDEVSLSAIAQPHSK